jgi:hypothetical protein
MKAFGMKALEEGTGRSLSILYRWRKAILAGRGISDRNKRLLIAVTAGSPYAIEWSDFEPAELERAA